MPEQGFPLPGSSYKELIKIIQAYGEVGSDVVPADVARVAAMNETVVSRNNRFLAAVGIVQGGKKKTVTSAGSELALALQHGMENEIAAKWRTIVDATDFLLKVVAAVRIRKGMDESSLESHVAYSAGQPKTPLVATGAGTVVEILKTAGLLKEDGGNLVATTPEPGKSLESVQQSVSVSVPDTLASAQFPVSTLPLRPGLRSAGTVQLSIEVRIECTPDNLEGLGQKLKKVLADFSQPDPTPPTPENTGEAE